MENGRAEGEVQKGQVQFGNYHSGRRMDLLRAEMTSSLVAEVVLNVEGCFSLRKLILVIFLKLKVEYL